MTIVCPTGDILHHAETQDNATCFQVRSNIKLTSVHITHTSDATGRGTDLMVLHLVNESPALPSVTLPDAALVSGVSTLKLQHFLWQSSPTNPFKVAKAS